MPTPSNASARALEGKLIDASAAIHEVAFESLKVCFSPGAVDDHFVEAASGFLKMLGRFDQKEAFGFFKDGLIRGEVAQTSVATEYLCRQFSEQDGVFLHWMHQLLDPSLGKMDIALYVSETCDGPIAPVAVIEVGFKGSSKQWQAAAYAVNIASQCKDDARALLSVEVALDRGVGAPDLSLRCYASPSEAEAIAGVPGSLWTTTIWKGSGDADALARLFKTIVTAAPLCVRDHEPLFARMGANVGVTKDMIVHKFFDYRDRAVPEEERRSANNCVKFVRGTQMLLQATDLTVVSYPFIEGQHWACTVQQMIDVSEHLKELHEKDVCHGDVRAYNMLFCKGVRSCLIDFDFAGKSGAKKYPPGYSHAIDDAKRHRSAVAGARLAKEHDCFSLASVMELHACENRKEIWTSIIDLVRRSKLADAIQKMQEVAELELQPSDVLRRESSKKINAGPVYVWALR